MEPLDQMANTISLTMGVAWASGINLYAAILVLGLLGTTGNITLPASLQILADPMVMTAAGVMYFVEFFADKMPGVDTFDNRVDDLAAAEDLGGIKKIFGYIGRLFKHGKGDKSSRTAN